jgi:hypothetical protein
MDLEFEEKLGKTKLADKTIKPMSTVSSISPANFIIGSRTSAYGAVVLGDYKGQARFLDLNKLVNLPLVTAEQLNITGILDGREESYDLKTITVPNGAINGTPYSGSLTVPAGKVWYLNAVQTLLDATGSAHGLTGNWRCTILEDRSTTPSVNGQAFYGAALVRAAGGATTWLAEFGPIATAWLITNKTVLLRVPAGAKITLEIATTTANATAAVACVLSLRGFSTLALVD